MVTFWTCVAHVLHLCTQMFDFSPLLLLLLLLLYGYYYYYYD